MTIQGQKNIVKFEVTVENDLICRMTGETSSDKPIYDTVSMEVFQGKEYF